MKTSTVRGFAGLIALVMAIAAPNVHAGGYVFTNFDGPDSGAGTTINGINNNGAIVGFGTNTSGVDTNFIRNPDGSFTILTTINNSSTTAMANGINITPEIVGTSNGAAFTFVNNTLTNLPAAGGITPTVAFGINDKGMIVGQYSSTATLLPGFLDNNGTYTSLKPVSPVNGVLVVNANGINNNGLVTGFYTTNNTTPPVDGNEPQHGFFYDSKTGHYTLVADPNKPNFFTVQLLSVNDFGIAAGYWQDKTGNQHGLLYNFSTGKYTFLDDPNVGAIGGLVTTQITGINDAGTITGFYSDAKTGTFRGFVASVVPEPGSLALMGIGLTLAGGFVVRRSRGGRPNS